MSVRSPSVGEPGYLPYCGRCSGLRRMRRGESAFVCDACQLETRMVNGEDMFDRTAPLPTTPAQPMSAEKVAACGQCRFAFGVMCRRDPVREYLQAYETRYDDSDFCGPRRRYFKRRTMLGRIGLAVRNLLASQAQEKE